MKKSITAAAFLVLLGITSRKKEGLDGVFNHTYEFYQLGAAYDNDVKNALWEYNLSREFDGLVFVNKTTACMPL
jgi:erythromycin esterase-like protein